jgi:DNA helicase HerA-like ATPase
VVLDATTTGTTLGRTEPADGAPTAEFGVHRAPDGTDGASVSLDLDGPHAALVVGKRGSGKSYTLGVLAEELARTDGVAPVVVDPMSVFDTLAGSADGAPVPARIHDDPTVPADAVAPRSWCRLLDVDPASPAGSLLWRVADRGETVAAMRAAVADADAPAATRRAVENHLALAAAWGVFDPDAPPLLDGAVTVLDAADLPRPALNALVRGVADRLYRARVDGETDRLPWLLVDEAHVPLQGVAAGALRRLLTRGRRPGVSTVLATQRPAALPEVAHSQADLTVAHRLTSRPDREAMARARPTYASAADRRPTAPGEATVVDDATESVRSVRVRERDTPHGGASPRVSDRRR